MLISTLELEEGRETDLKQPLIFVNRKGERVERINTRDKFDDLALANIEILRISYVEFRRYGIPLHSNVNEGRKKDSNKFK